MIEAGNLRIKMRDKSIWATILSKQAAMEDHIFYCPFSKTLGMKNIIDNGYELTYYDGNTSEGEYVGGTISCTNVAINLSADWAVEFEYAYTGNMEKTVGDTKTNLGNSWNIIFAFGTHVLDHGAADSPRYSLPVKDSEPTLTEQDVWCSVLDPQVRHLFRIQHTSGTTTVFINGVEQETKQFSYPNYLQGFYLSGGSNKHSLSCRIKNLSIYGTLAG